MMRALDEFVIEGPKTTIPIQSRRSSMQGEFRAGEHDTGFVERFLTGTSRGAAPAEVGAT